jgi:SNF2 family DNA or RNA helicase
MDLLDFPTIIFMQTAYNVYTVQQASRRSWRIGQTLDVKVVFLSHQLSFEKTSWHTLTQINQMQQSTIIEK